MGHGLREERALPQESRQRPMRLRARPSHPPLCASGASGAVGLSPCIILVGVRGSNKRGAPIGVTFYSCDRTVSKRHAQILFCQSNFSGGRAWRKRSDHQPIRLPGLKPGVCSGLILSGAFYPDLKIGVWRRERINSLACGGSLFEGTFAAMMFERCSIE